MNRLENIRKLIQSQESDTFDVRVEPRDWTQLFGVNWHNFAEKIIEAYPPKYRDKLIGLRKDGWSYEPVFDEETQREWDAAYDDYISGKAAWCQKYGCE